MYDGVFPFLYPAFASAFGRGEWPRPGSLKETGGFPRYSIYRTGDGRFLAVAVTEEKFWVEFRAAIGLAHQAGDGPDSADNLRKAIADIILTKNAAEWQAILASDDLPCSVVKTFEEAVQSPLFAERRILGRTVRLGETTLPALPVPVAEHFREQEETRPVPALGEANSVLLDPAREDA
jgi:crotonobetainyl-CoA:carnitine CoA-transferase CaiB-like acyl-CoA transferase